MKRSCWCVCSSRETLGRPRVTTGFPPRGGKGGLCGLAPPPPGSGSPIRFVQNSVGLAFDVAPFCRCRSLGSPYAARHLCGVVVLVSVLDLPCWACNCWGPRATQGTFPGLPRVLLFRCVITEAGVRVIDRATPKGVRRRTPLVRATYVSLREESRPS